MLDLVVKRNKKEKTEFPSQKMYCLFNCFPCLTTKSNPIHCYFYIFVSTVAFIYSGQCRKGKGRVGETFSKMSTARNRTGTTCTCLNHYTTRRPVICFIFSPVILIFHPLFLLWSAVAAWVPSRANVGVQASHSLGWKTGYSMGLNICKS